VQSESAHLDPQLLPVVRYDRRTVILAMADRLQNVARDEQVDLGDERSIELCLRRAGFDRVSIYRMGDQAVEIARRALQRAASAAAGAAEAGALILLLGAWVFAYVSLCPA
jgi:hypothetical protein